MKRIAEDNKIFKSEEFQKDKYKFHLIFKNFGSTDLLLYSDEENYVACRGKVGLPTWIWTKDRITKDKVKEIEEVIKLYLTDETKNNFTCKKELYDELVKDKFVHLNIGKYFEMGFLICNKTKKPKSADGKFCIPNIEDKDILTKYWYDDSREMNNVSPVSLEQAAIDVQEMFDSKKYYIWRNDAGKIVSMCNYTVADGQAKISHVYTPIEERGKGYAANLIYAMTNLILEQGLVPLLYTDYKYIPSNRAYINAGYEDKGILINFSCSK